MLHFNEQIKRYIRKTHERAEDGKNKTKYYSVVVSTLHWTGSVYDSKPTDQLSLLSLFEIFPRPSRQKIG
jgi:hypothetical protein